MTHKIPLFLMILIALLAFSIDGLAQDDDYEEQLEEAELLLQEGDYKDAIKAFKKARKLVGEPRFECCYGLADAFVGIGAYKNAAESAREALTVATTIEQKLQAYNKLGLSLFADGNAGAAQLQEAAALFEAVLDLARELPPQQRPSVPRTFQSRCDFAQAGAK